METGMKNSYDTIGISNWIYQVFVGIMHISMGQLRIKMSNIAKRRD